ncbi:3-isopropylmalate dehydratase small subunit [bacterium]|nr:3-isopropylmalate dehydratase small subunit [bacterium]
MKFKGKVHKFGDDVNTDEIIPAKYLVTTNPKELAKHCLEGRSKNFARKVRPGDIIVAGRNFGCGSSREHAPLAIKGCGVSCVIAPSFARIFFRNCINMGLPILESKEAAKEARQNDILQIDLSKGEIKNISRKKIYRVPPFPKFLQRIISSGGLMNSIR